MLKNYFNVDENSSVQEFLREVKEKKNYQYIILADEKNFIDVRTMALRINSPNEKLKGLKKPLSVASFDDEEKVFEHFVASGDRVIKTKSGDYYDFVDALEYVSKSKFSILDEKIEDIEEKKQVFALDHSDKIAQAREFLISKKVNLLPVINGLEVVGEIRPQDLIIYDLISDFGGKGDLVNENFRISPKNLPITNLYNTRPLHLDSSQKLSEAIKLMKDKAVPSIIIMKDEEFYGVLSYKDIFKKILSEFFEEKFKIEVIGSKELYDDELDLVEDFANRTMKKINKISTYDNLKLSFKSHGHSESSHKRKITVNLLLSSGKNIIPIEKEIIEGSDIDEDRTDKIKGRWNPVLLVNEALSTLEKKVKEEKSRSN